MCNSKVAKTKVWYTKVKKTKVWFSKLEKTEVVWYGRVQKWLKEETNVYLVASSGPTSTVYSTYRKYSIQYTVHTVYSIQYTVHTVYSMQYTVPKLFTVYKLNSVYILESRAD